MLDLLDSAIDRCACNGDSFSCTTKGIHDKCRVCHDTQPERFRMLGVKRGGMLGFGLDYTLTPFSPCLL
jgi:hypothetical protein